MVFKIVFLLISLSASGQNKYWVYLDYSAPSDAVFRVDDLQDFVNEAHVRQLNEIGQVETMSRWLNAVSIYLKDSNALIQTQKLPFVREIVAVSQFEATSSGFSTRNTETSLALKQINGLAMHEAGFMARGVKIGIIDGGFFKADQEEALAYSIGRVGAFRDYVTPKNKNPFYGRESHLDWHGSVVWKMIGGYDSNSGVVFGLATKAQFYLARTDHGKKESRVEEDYLVAALEWMDSLGIRLVNISLGYAKGFDNPKENHYPAELDGKSSALTRAVQIAVEKKGMIIVTSAGNEGGDKNWRILSIPADAKDVISVGSTRFESAAKASYSSVGPEALEYIKPDLACYSGTGTSFSAPVITGLVACMLEYDSTFTHGQIKELLISSSNLYPYANNYIGYGVPNVDKLVRLMKYQTVPTSKASELRVRGKSYTLKVEGKEAVVFHKKDTRNVILQEVVSEKRKKIKVIKPEGALYTTIVLEGELMEIFWE